MKNSKGQTLVMFVVFLPLFLIIVAFIIDIGIMYYKKIELDNLNTMVIKYGINHLDEDNLQIKLDDLITKNDNKINKKRIKIKNSLIEIKLEKDIDSIFGKIIGLKTYNIKSYYIGTNINNKKEIKKG